MNMAAKVAAGGVLALIGYAAIKFLFGLIGAVTAFTFLVLFKVVPVLLVIWLAVWIVRKIARSGNTGTA